MLASSQSFVMAGHSASKTRVERACVPAIHVLLVVRKVVDARHKAGHDAELGA